MNNITLNASELITNRMGQQLPDVTATIRDLGTFEALYFAFLVYIAAVVTHELFHWFVLLRHNPNARIFVKRKSIGLQLQTGTEADYMVLTANDRLTLYSLGIFGGLIPIVIAMAIHPIYALVLPGYLVGCLSDIRMIRDTFRAMREEEKEE